MLSLLTDSRSDQVQSELVNSRPTERKLSFTSESSSISDQPQHEKSVSLNAVQGFNISRHSSLMLSSGSRHEVWKPGLKLSCKNHFSSDNILAARKLSMLNSMKGMQEVDGGVVVTAGNQRRKSHGMPDKELLERRRKQWQQIEAQEEDNPSTPRVTHLLKHSLTDSSMLVTSEEFDCFLANVLLTKKETSNHPEDVALNADGAILPALGSENKTVESEPCTSLCPIEEEKTAAVKEMESEQYELVVEGCIRSSDEYETEV